MQRNLSIQYLPAIAVLIMLLIAPIAADAINQPAACRDLIQKERIVGETPLTGYAAVSACLPWRADLWEETAHEALQAKQPEAAISYLENARQQAILRGKSDNNALSQQGMQDLAKAYQLNGNFSAALEILQSIADETGLDIKQTKTISELYLARGDFDGAVAIWQKLAGEQPDNAEALYQTGLFLITRDPENALPVLEKAVQLDPTLEKNTSNLRQAIMGARLVDDPAYTQLQAGRALAAIDRWDLAAEAFREAILKQPNYAEAWAFLGEARQHLPTIKSSTVGAQDTGAQGLYELQTALQLDPQSLSTYLFLALYWMRHSNYKRALEAITRANALSPDNPALTAELAGIQAASGDFYDAYDTYLKAAALSPYEPEYKRRIIRFSLEYNFNIEEVALPIARQLLAGETQDPIDLDLMAQVLIMQDDISNAERFLVKAISGDPRNAAAHLHLGLVYLLHGDKNSAVGELELASSLDPGGPVEQQAQRLLSGGVP
jgi:tetratricopeptide (TPR) repeat protein